MSETFALRDDLDDAFVLPSRDLPFAALLALRCLGPAYGLRHTTDGTRRH
ncbi:MAG: hypothetical protein ACR2L2_06915 [Acidobacteriota bacterium]